MKHCCDGPELGKFEKPWSDGIEIIEFMGIITGIVLSRWS